jgi:hypothetical protein
MSHAIEVAFDIETVAAPEIPELTQNLLAKITVPATHKKPEAIQKYKDDAALDMRSEAGLTPMTGRIAAICMYGKTAEGKGIDIRIIEPDEKVLLEIFWKKAYDLYKESKGSLQWISYNGKSFDVWFIRVRSALHGITPTVRIEQKRFDTNGHFDVRECLTNFGGNNKGKLDDWCIVFGIPRKIAEGSQVQSMWDSGEHDKITDYCLGDCVSTFLLKKKIERYF